MDEGLTEMAKWIGEEFGFEEVEAAYAPFRDLKVRWKRSCGWIWFEVSDYLCDAPEGVLEGLFRTIFERIRGDWKTGYPDDVRGWLESADFRARNQETYIQRSRHIDAGHDTAALWASYDRLVADGRIERMEGLRLFWSDSGCSDKAGESSCLMRVVSMNPALRDAGTEVLDYCLLYHLANIQVGFDVDNARRQEMVTVILDEVNDNGLDTVKDWLKTRDMVV